MAIEQHKDVENGDNQGLEDLQEPLVKLEKKAISYEDSESDVSVESSSSIVTVLLSTFVAVCGSFEFGSCVSTPMTGAEKLPFPFFGFLKT